MSWNLFLCNELLCGDATLQPSFWHVFGDEGKNTVSWKVLSFLLLTIDATKSIMNLYKPSKFKMRTEDTEISLRNLTFTQMEDIIPSLCPSHHQTHRLGDRWQGDTHQHQQPASWRSPSRAAGDQSRASPGGGAQKASWERHAISGNAKDLKPRPVPPQLRNWARVLYPAGRGIPHQGRFLSGRNSNQSTDLFYRLGPMREMIG